MGVFGGTFDPIHKGHVAVCQYVLSFLSLDSILFIPARNPRLREGKLPQATSKQRLEMVKIALRERSQFQVSDIELHRCGPSYTVDTLKEINNKFNSVSNDVYLIVGSDVINRFHQWHEYETILISNRLIVYGRPGYKEPQHLPNKLATYKERIQFVNGPEYGFSATSIRNALWNGERNIDGLTSEVEDYIKKEKIYVEEKQ